MDFRVFGDLRVASFGLVLLESCSFFGLVFCFADGFFSNFMAILLFQYTVKRNLGAFLREFDHFGLVSFQICLPSLFLIYLPFFCFVQYTCKTHFGPVF